MSQQNGLQEEEKENMIACEGALISCYNMADASWQKSNVVTYSIGYVSRVIFEGYGNNYIPNFTSTMWRIQDHEVTDNLKQTK